MLFVEQDIVMRKVLPVIETNDSHNFYLKRLNFLIRKSVSTLIVLSKILKKATFDISKLPQHF